MDIRNSSQVTIFVFSGLTDDDKLIPFLFILILFIYLVTIIGNVGLIAIVLSTSKLHMPMYFFLSCLSMVDLCYSSSVTPKMLADLISVQKIISFNGCAMQLFFSVVMSASEVPLLSSMSYDRYVAVCQPLHYVSIMTKKKCLTLIGLSYFFGFVMSLIPTSCVFSLRYCGPNLIDHFYCDVPFVMPLSCSGTLYCTIISMFFIGLCGLISLVIIVTSYSLILATIIGIKSSEGRKKAFSTCSSHLLCVTIFYIAIFFTFLQDPSSVREKRHKVVSVFYLVVIPMLNPLIYSLRNQEVKNAIKHGIYKSTHLT
ncbi:olfactory receptor 5AR1-like [Hyperolius riggenbachi]|uniref:olfactory receptor 5AR1-like n=1 Tax=Hyperolius riggenbachi TaxID=752182 RepID=UPI0035A35774